MKRETLGGASMATRMKLRLAMEQRRMRRRLQSKVGTLSVRERISKKN
jgi:hypothetical protein